jgi:hypothetical protein
MAKINITSQVEPAVTPASGLTDIYIDATTKTLMSKDDTGTVTDYTAGDVVGPASNSADGNVPRFNGTTGKIIQDSAINIDDTDKITGVTSLDIRKLMIMLSR